MPLHENQMLTWYTYTPPVPTVLQGLVEGDE